MDVVSTFMERNTSAASSFVMANGAAVEVVDETIIIFSGTVSVLITKCYVRGRQGPCAAASARPSARPVAAFMLHSAFGVFSASFPSVSQSVSPPSALGGVYRSTERQADAPPTPPPPPESARRNGGGGGGGGSEAQFSRNWQGGAAGGAVPILDRHSELGRLHAQVEH